MRLWTDEMPYEKQTWNFYRPGTDLIEAAGPQVIGRYRIVGRQMTWTGNKIVMRAELEPVR